MKRCIGLATTRELYGLRQKLGKTGEPFDIMLCPIEPMTPEIQAELEGAGADYLMALPRTPSPSERVPWVKEGEGHACLDIKRKAMERYAHQVGL